MPATPLFHPADASAKLTGRLGRLTKREAGSLAALKQLVRKQGLSLGLVRGPGEQNDVCLLRFLRASGFEEKRALAWLVSCVEWGATVGLSGLRGHLGGDDASGFTLPPGAEGLACLASGVDIQGRPLVILRLGAVTHELVDTCGKKALLRYFVWSVERLLERVATSMLSTQFIIEGVVLLCDAKGWSQRTASDEVLSVLKDIVDTGLSRYPERLGQLWVVNVPSEDALHISLAARALGFGAAMEAGRLRILQGDRPKWAPVLLKAIQPEHLPVEYGGTASALPPLPSRKLADVRRTRSRGTASIDRACLGAKNPQKEGVAPIAARMGFARLVSGGRITYRIGGLHIVALLVTLWAVYRTSSRGGEAAVWALIAALAAKEWIGGPATVASAGGQLPLLHDPGAVHRAAQGNSARRAIDERSDAAAATERGFEASGEAVRHDGGGGGGSGGVYDDDASARIELTGAKVEIVDIVGMGPSGFDRFCMKLQAASTEGGSNRGAAEASRTWTTWRRLTDFVALRAFLVQDACPGAEGADRDPRIWKLPPEVPATVLVRRLEAWLQRLLERDESANRGQLRDFLIGDHGPRPGDARVLPPALPPLRPPGIRIPEADSPRGASRSRRQTVPLSSSAEGRSALLASGVGEAEKGTPSLGSDEQEKAGARKIPSLRPELQDMFQDPQENHALKMPEREQNQWLKRASRASGQVPSNASYMEHPPRVGGVPASPAHGGDRSSAGDEKPRTPTRSRGRSSSLQVTPPQNGGARGEDDRHFGRSGPSLSPRRRDAQTSPRRREALKRFVSMVKRRGTKRVCTGDAALFRLLHVDIFEVPPENLLHRVDHIVGLAGGRAQARVRELTAENAEGANFLFVVNLQLPRCFSKTGRAASVVLYWGMPVQELGGEGGRPSRSPPAATASNAEPPVQPQNLSPFERALLMRYIDLPFNRMGRSGSGLLSSSTAGRTSAELARAKGKSGVEEGGGGVPGFSAVDEDESESGIFSDKDFRNMSLKVVTSVVEGRWTVRKAVDEGNSQVLSRKVTQRYFRGSLYMETDIEVGSSVAAESVVGVCLTEPSVLDVGFFLEGGSRVLGCVRACGVNPALAEPLLLAATAPPMLFAPPFSQPPSPAETAPVTPASPPLSQGIPLGSAQFATTWEDNSGSHAFRVRGPGYLSGGGKVDAGRPFGKLVRADLFKMEAGVDRVDNIASVGKAAKVVRRLQKSREFLVIVNLQVPGNPPLSMVLYYALPVPPGGEPAPGTDGRPEGFLGLFRRFVDLGPMNNSDEADADAEGIEQEAGGGGRLPGEDLRNLRFKLFPAILEGPWIVRKAVGSKPALIAQKLTCRYFRTRAYFEVDIDIGSSVVAYNTVSLAIGYAKSLVVDMGFCVQGETENELPEVLLGVARIRRLDVLLADSLGVNEDHEDTDEECSDSDESSEDTASPPSEGLRGLPEGTEGSVESVHPRPDGPRQDDEDDTPGASTFVVVPGGAGGNRAAQIASPGLEDVFSDSGRSHGLKVRGATYVSDGRKINAGASFGTLLRADLFRIDGARHHLFRVDHICTHGRMKDRIEFLQAGPNPPFLFVVNIQMPGDRAHSVVLCWGMRLKEAEEAAAANRLKEDDANFLALFRRYIDLDLEGGLPINDIRNRRLKLFPKVLQGPWVVRKAVGKPCIIGRRLTARYFRRPGYFEVDIDVGSSALASNATHLAGGYAKNLVLDLAFALQGEAAHELPERLIGSARIDRPDLGRAESLDG